MESTSRNKIIAKNATMLYIRMVVLMLVNLYSSRIVLRELGVEDFGVYNVVGGIVSLFIFLNTTMSSATSRFLTYELGSGNLTKLKATFKTSLTLHIGVALIIVFLAETFGLWFVNYKLVIPTDRMFAANVVYQFSILTIVIKTVQVPFNASIISNEKMNIYAIAELFHGFALILMISCLTFFKGDKLILYSIIITVLALFLLLIYSIYTLRKFREVSLGLNFSKYIMLPMLKFSSFDLYGNMCSTARIQGLSILINWFFGPMLNAANGIAVQVQSALLTLSNNVITAFRPQIIKQYARGHIHLMEQQVNYASMISFLLFSVLAVPVLLEVPYILEIWLETPPMYTVSITRVELFACWITVLIQCLNIPIYATGKIKKISLLTGNIYLLSVFITYFILKIFTFPVSAYYTMLFFYIILIFPSCYILKRNIPSFSLKEYWLKNIFRCVICVVVSSVITLHISHILPVGIIRLLLVFLIYSISLLSFSSFILLNRSQRKKIFVFLMSKFK